MLARLHPWQVVLGVTLIYLAVILGLHGGDPRAWATVSPDYGSCDDPGYDPGNTPGGGYIDGQMTYFIARDLGAAAVCADVPAYRMQRILLPVAARLLSLGNPALIPWALVALNLAGLLIGTALLEGLLAQRGVSRWYALVYGLAAGNLLSVRLSTTEALAFGLVVFAIWLDEHERPWWQAVLLLLAGLAKEQTLVFAGGYLLYDLLSQRWRDALRLILIVGLPFVLWQWVLLHSFGSTGIGSGGEGATGFEWIPFGGYLRIFSESGGSLGVFLVMSTYIFPSVILPTLIALGYGLGDLLRRDWPPDLWLLLANCAVMVTLPFTTFGEPLGLLRVMLGLQLAYLLYGARRFPAGRALRYAPLWLVLNFYLVAG